MKVTHESTGELTARINLDFTEEDYKDRVNKQLKELAKKANIPGFRAGKVPVGVVKKMYGQGVLAEEVNKLISESLYKYIEEQKLTLLGNPLPSEDHQPVDFDTQKDFEMRFDIGLQPEINLDFLSELEVDYNKVIPDQKMLDLYIDDMKNRFGEHIEAESWEEGYDIQGGFVQLDENGAGQDDALKTEGAVNLDDILDEEMKEAFKALKVGDDIFFNPMKIVGNDAHKATHFVYAKHEDEARMDSDFRFVCDKISKLVPAELNEELYKKAFPKDELKTEEEFMNRLKEEAIKSFAPQTDNSFLNTAVDAVVEKANVNLPDEFLKRWIKSSETEERKVNVDQEYDSYARMFRWQIVETQLAQKFDELKLSRQDMLNEVKKFFVAQYFQGIPAEHIEAQDAMLTQMAEKALQNEQEAEQIRNQVMNTKLIALFKKELKVKENEISFEEFAALNAANMDQEDDGIDEAVIEEETKDNE